MDKLSDQLATLLITRQVIGNIKEAVLPAVLGKLKLSRVTYQMTKNLSDVSLQRHVEDARRNRSKVKLSGRMDSLDMDSPTEDLIANVIAATAPKTIPESSPIWFDLGSGSSNASSPPSSPQPPPDPASVYESNGLRLRRLQPADPPLVKGEAFCKEDSGLGGGSKMTDDDQGSPDHGSVASPGKRSLSGSTDQRSMSQEDEMASSSSVMTEAQLQLTQAEVESLLSKYASPLEDYLEMYIQFGYVLLFSPAFPLAALCALVNNIIEIRVDAFKLCTSFQRPFGRRVEDIGFWQPAMEFMGILGVIVNCALIGQSGLMHRFWPGLTSTGEILLVVFLEHIILALKFVIAYAIPDVPHWVTVETAKMEYKRREALKALECRVRRRHRSESVNAGRPPLPANARRSSHRSSAAGLHGLTSPHYRHFRQNQHHHHRVITVQLAMLIDIIDAVPRLVLWLLNFDPVIVILLLGLFRWHYTV